MITAEVAIYPQKTNNASGVINNSINVLQKNNVKHSVNSMNTKLNGNKAEVFNNLEAMFSEAEKNGTEVNMVITVSNASD